MRSTKAMYSFVKGISSVLLESRVFEAATRSTVSPPMFLILMKHLHCLLLENSETRWNSEIEMIKLGRKPTQQDDDLFPTKYTGVGKSKQQRGFTKKFKGWSVDGIARYNQLRDKIKSDRKYHGEEFDAFLLNHFKETTQLGGADDAEETDDSRFILAKNDLFDDDGDIEEICDDGDNQIESESFEEACLNFN